MSKDKFNYDYYERGVDLGISGYKNYRWMPDLTLRMCKSIVSNLDISKSNSILDFGCAKGYIVKALRMLGYQSYGCDISEYAINSSPMDIREYLHLQTSNSSQLGQKETYDWILSKDVLEHIPYELIDDTIVSLKRHTDKIFIVVPLGDGEKYIIPDYEGDITHIIRENETWWFEKFNQVGFKNLEYCFKFPNVKEDWLKINERGNLFIYTKK